METDLNRFLVTSAYRESTDIAEVEARRIIRNGLRSKHILGLGTRKPKSVDKL